MNLSLIAKILLTIGVLLSLISMNHGTFLSSVVSIFFGSGLAFLWFSENRLKNRFK